MSPQWKSLEVSEESDPQSTLLRGHKREVFPRPATCPFDRSNREHKPLYLTSFTWKNLTLKPRQRTLSAPSQDWKTASHSSTGDPLAPQVAMGRHYAYVPLSSAVVRLVLEGKLTTFSIRVVATFTLFDQVSRACPWFSPLREASGRQSEICGCSSVPFPAPSTEI